MSQLEDTGSLDYKDSVGRLCDSTMCQLHGGMWASRLVAFTLWLVCCCCFADASAAVLLPPLPSVRSTVTSGGLIGARNICLACHDGYRLLPGGKECVKVFTAPIRLHP